MGIKGLTGRGAALPQIGVLRKGGKSIEKTNSQGKKYNSYGPDLEGFRFDTDDTEALERFTARYGDEPHSVDVYLPYVTAEENFWTCKEAWSASALQHRCDGEVCSRWLDKQTGKYSGDPIPCPGGCKEVGRLKIIIPVLRRMVYVVAETHSLHDIINIDQQLAALEEMRGSLRGIPMNLSRIPREISTPRSNGTRARVTKWLMSIEAAPSWVELQLQAMERQALPDGSPAPLALPAPQMVITDSGFYVDGETGQVIDHEALEQPAPATTSKRDMIIARITSMWVEAEPIFGELPDEQHARVMAMDEAALLEYGKKLRAKIDVERAKAAVTPAAEDEPQQEVIAVEGGAAYTPSRYADGQLAL
jgi:hypothetical protein